MFKYKLRKLFSPESVAVVGASESFDKVGYHVMKSLVKGGYRGPIYPINPNSKTLRGMKTYSTLLDIEGHVDLAVIVVPARAVPAVLDDCGKKGVSGVVLITAGYKEIEGDEGKLLEHEVKRISKEFEIPIIGPNTFGFVNLTDRINASFTYEFSLIKEGGVTLISQSGGFCHLIGFMAIEDKMGMAKPMSPRAKTSADFPEAVKYIFRAGRRAERDSPLY
ncbi:MAG: CoA-binding protein [Candidatus Bathyarchaeia archaeon]